MQKPEEARFITSVDKSGGIEVSGLKLLLSGYFLTYGVFGYGSSLDATRLVSFLPLITGVVFFMAVLWWIRTGGRDWTYTLRFDLTAVIAFLTIFVALVLMNWKRLDDELIGDELSYAQLSHAHALEALQFAPQVIEEFAGSTVVRLTSLMVITALVTGLWWLVWRPGIEVAALLTLIATVALQLFFSTQGGWGWGYTKVSWLPYLVGTTIFGISPTGFRLTSLVLIAAGLSLVFLVLRTFGFSILASAFVIGALVTVPSASAFFVSVDHVHLYVLLALPLAIFLLFPANPSLQMWLPTLLAVGISLRITTAFLMMTLLVWFGIKRKEAWTNEVLGHYVLPALFLLPYLVGIVINPPLGGRSPANPGDILEEPNKLLVALDSQIGFTVLALLLVGILMAIFRRQDLLGPAAFMLLIIYFYFFFLRGAGLVGEYKYTIEWVLSLTLIALVLALRAVGSTKVLPSLLIPAGVLVSNLFLPPFSSTAQESYAEAIQRQSPIGYEAVLIRLRDEPCQPVGVVYGAGSELTLGKPLSSVSQVREVHARLQEVILNQGRSWKYAYPDLAEDFGLHCLYGTRDSFPGLEEGAWQNWYVAMVSGFLGDDSSVLVLKQEGDAQQD